MIAEGIISSPDKVCEYFSKRDIKLKITQLDNDKKVVLIEGESESLEFLGNLLLAQASFERDCGFSLNPSGEGNKFFDKESTLGLYIHRLPCINHKKT